MIKLCNHLFVEGFGAMGDGVVCAKCGLDKYPEVIPLQVAFARLTGNFIPEGHPAWETYAEQARAARTKREAGA